MCSFFTYPSARAQPVLAAGVKSPNTIGQTSCAALSRSDSDDNTESLQARERTAGTFGDGAGAALGVGGGATQAAAIVNATKARRRFTTLWSPSSSYRRPLRRPS